MTWHDRQCPKSLLTTHLMNVWCLIHDTTWAGSGTSMHWPLSRVARTWPRYGLWGCLTHLLWILFWYRSRMNKVVRLAGNNDQLIELVQRPSKWQKETSIVSWTLDTHLDKSNAVKQWGLSHHRYQFHHNDKESPSSQHHQTFFLTQIIPLPCLRLFSLPLLLYSVSACICMY